MSARSSKSSARAGKREALAKRFDRDRYGKRSFTNAEVLARWKRIRDGALIQLEELVCLGEHKGQLSVTDTIIKAQSEINGLERLLGVGKVERKFEWAESTEAEA